MNFIIRKDSKGQPLARENLSLLLNTNGLDYFEILYDQYERTQEYTDSLRRFKTTNSTLSFVDNRIVIPADYAHKGFLYYKKGGIDVKPIHIVDDDLFMMKQNSFIEYPTEDYPIARFINGYIEYLPTTLDKNYFTFSYLRYPESPVYDYYIDVNGVVHYLNEGEIHTWVTGEEDSLGFQHTTGDSDWDSLTKELDFNEEDKLKIAYRILQAVGVPIDEAGVFQYAQQLKVES
jgi:hypothetical protein